ncbi:hypothetical protein Hdeb2414_s0008g00286541 [Helianthus debilis subsp. tardiflorus]
MLSSHLLSSAAQIKRMIQFKASYNEIAQIDFHFPPPDVGGLIRKHLQWRR